MRRKAIPGTDLTVSEVVFGTVDLGTRFSQEESFRFLDAYVELGGNFIDTATFYGNWFEHLERSICEKIVGRWRSSRGARDLVIASKCSHPPNRAQMHIHRLHPEDIRADLENTLKNLKLETVDLYYLLRDDESYPCENVITTLNEEIRKGKIRHIGASNWKPYRIERANRFARANGLAGFCANQMMWSLAVPNWDIIPDPSLEAMDEECLDFHLRSGVAVIPYSCMANGYFHTIGQGVQALHPKAGHRFVSEENLARHARVMQLGRETGLSVSEIVMGYIMSQPMPTFPIVGFDSVEQLKDTVDSSATRLCRDQLMFLTGNKRI